MSAAGTDLAVIGQAAEMARAHGVGVESLNDVLGWLDKSEMRATIDLVPLAMIAEILTCLFAADERQR